MSGRSLEDLEGSVERLIAALAAERKTARNLAIQVAELQARLERTPEGLVGLQNENRRLRRNSTVAAAKIEELLQRL